MWDTMHEKKWSDAIDLLATKEQLLSEIIVWLKAKDLWEECKKSLSIKITSTDTSGGR